MLSRYEKVTPAMARDLIAKNTNLCPLDEKKVRRFARKMRWGFWNDDSDDPIIINDLGYLTDGQHRIYACAKSEKPITVRIIRCGADNTKSKNPRLEYKGVNLSECIRVLWILEKTGNRYDKNIPLGGDYDLFHEQVSEENLRRSVDVIPLDDGFLKSEIAVAIHWVLLGRGKQKADEYFQLLYDKGNPLLDYVRGRLEVPRTTERYKVYCLIWGWNCWTGGQSGFGYEKDKPLPRINNPKKKIFYKGEH